MQLDPACAASYANHYHKLNPFEALAAESGPLRIFRWLAILKSQKFKMNSAALSGGRNSSRPVCHVQPMAAQIAFQRSAGAIWITPKEWHLLETLAPHLMRAAEIYGLLPQPRGSAILSGGSRSGGICGFPFDGRVPPPVRECEGGSSLAPRRSPADPFAQPEWRRAPWERI